MSAERWPTDPDLFDFVLIVIWTLLLLAVISGLEQAGGSW